MIQYNMCPIQCDGNIVSFDGKGDTQAKKLIVERFYGDIRLRDQAIQEFCFDNGYTEAVIKFY